MLSLVLLMLLMLHFLYLMLAENMVFEIILESISKVDAFLRVLQHTAALEVLSSPQGLP